MVAADLLVTDRLAEFQRKARDKGTLKEDGNVPSDEAVGEALPTSTSQAFNISARLLGLPAAPDALASTTAAASTGKGRFMEVFFKKVSEINRVLSEGKANVKGMGDILEDALQATTPEKQKEVSDRLYEKVQETNQKIHKVKNDLEELRKDTEHIVQEDDNNKCPGNCGYLVTYHQTHCCNHCAKQNGHGEKCEKKKPLDKAKVQEIRTNMQNQLAKKHLQLLMDFQKAQLDFKEALNQRQVREIHMVLPEASEEQVAEMLESGTSLSLVVAQKMAGTHHALIDEVNRIQDKHQDILRLERSAADLAQMFQEMAVLVDSQGEMLDAIEIHVNKAKVLTAKAEENLITTRKAQASGQKWMCCLAAVMLVILISILFPVIISAT
jgi:syntaxin 1A